MLFVGIAQQLTNKTIPNKKLGVIETDRMRERETETEREREI